MISSRTDRHRQTLGQALHELAFAGHVLDEEKEHELGQHDGIDALVAVAAVEPGDFGAHAGEVNDGQHAAQRVVLADAVFEVDPVAEELCLRLVDAHHIQDRITQAPGLFKDSIAAGLIWATGAQDAPSGSLSPLLNSSERIGIVDKGETGRMCVQN